MAVRPAGAEAAAPGPRQHPVGNDPAWLGRLTAGWRALGCAAALGVLTAGALPPLTIMPLLLVTIPGLLLLIGRAASWRGAALRGLVFGIFLHLAGLYWVTFAVLVMAAQFWWAVPITVPLLAAVLAVFIAVPCALARCVPAGWRRAAVLAGAWVLGDLARQFVLSGFPWNLLGSVWEMPGTIGLVFMQPAAWVGVHGLTLATLLLAASPSLGRRGRITGAALFAAWAIAGFLRLQAAAVPFDLVAVIAQGNVPEADHRDHGADPVWAGQIFDRYLALTRAGVRQAQAEDPGRPILVVWPETASPYALGQDPGARLAVADASAPAVMTLAGAERFEAAGPVHNSLIAVAPGGGLAGWYDKSHLVPFGEYFPSYAHLLLGEQGFVPGPGVRTLHLSGLPAIGPLICYEAIFPGQVVRAVDPPDLLVNITNDAWFGDSAGPRQHLAAARLRSVEEGLPMVRAANTGISAVIDAHGRLVKELGLNQRGVLISQIPGRLPRPPAARFGLILPFGLALAVCALGLLAGNQKPAQV